MSFYQEPSFGSCHGRPQEGTGTVVTAHRNLASILHTEPGTAPMPSLQYTCLCLGLGTGLG